MFAPRNRIPVLLALVLLGVVAYLVALVIARKIPVSLIKVAIFLGPVVELLFIVVRFSLILACLMTTILLI